MEPQVPASDRAVAQKAMGFAIPSPKHEHPPCPPPSWGTPMWLHSSAVPFSAVVAVSFSQGQALERGRWALARPQKDALFFWG